MKINFYNETELDVKKHIKVIKKVFKQIKSKMFFNLIFPYYIKLSGGGVNVFLVCSGQNGPVNVCNFDGANKCVSGQVNHHKYHNDGNGTQNLVVCGGVFVNQFVNDPTNQSPKGVCNKVDCSKATNQRS